METKDKDCIINALLAEMQAIQSYSDAARIIENNEFKRYFKLFESNEYSHKEGLKKLISKNFNSKQMEELDIKINGFKPYRLEEKMDAKTIINKALSGEEIQYKRYIDCAGFVQDADTKKMFYAFADNEKLHAQVLKKMLITLSSLKTEKSGKCKICGNPIALNLGLCAECAKKELLKNNQKS
ncbi:MAG: ferritin family protein [archaeon]